MAVFGVQLTISIIVASIISKLGGKLSLARYLLCNTGLMRFLHPSDDELRELSGVKEIPTGKGKGKGKSQDIKNPNSFHVPKDLDITLDSIQVTPIEVTHLKFYPEYHWVVDYTVYATIVYIATEIYYAVLKPQNDMNLSVFWCFLVLFICLSVLRSITAIYFQGDELMGERAMCMVMGLGYLLVAMIVLIIDESNLEVGIDSAYESFHENASVFLKAQGLPSTGPASKLIIKFSIAVCCGLLGALFTFPGIRMSKMFYDSLRYCEGRRTLKFLFNLTYISPLVLAALWIKPIARDVLTKEFGTSEALMTDATFDSLRIILIVITIVLRIALMPFFLQSFLNIAQDKLTDLRAEAGRILNTDLQKKVTGIFYYLCIVALQYITPCLVCLHCCFLYKTLGEGSWVGNVWGQENVNGTTPIMRPIMPDTDDVRPAAEHITLALSSLKVVFNPVVFRGIFGFATWWCLFLLFASSAVGSAYLSYTKRA